MSDHLDPLGRTFFEHTRPDGGLELEVAPGQYVCDFCLNPNPVWEYSCGPIAIVGNPNIDASDDEWFACDACHRLIEEGDLEKMVADMVGRQPPPAPPFQRRPLAQQLAIQTVNVGGFLAARTGPPRPIQR
jgi:hypothetical protein